ncbi:ATP:cob(I)alamin adenosyltransferase [Acanthamoeba castellanii str. Neff]|uniref:Corrinoid adenosyltransferase MMAB n=1 Tax=Acanthamoeba castellanii (strain ATCC 30010 / Neff) TaxID=1257118 RepID=L8GGP9_ACACF|nr:ATP:cob(I)alamin adenosyltransferase [Acanthamoeba castellanii str. Neff]ELR12260.1 ATP:cob(I)alamin adenosyltransferase [Acanthamoeba castellanii str. Neff]
MEEAGSTASPATRKKSALYTRTGDKGESSLYTGERRAKDDAIFEALGTIDELNSHLGVASEYCKLADNGLHVYIEEIQARLMDVGSAVATPETSATEPQKAKMAFGMEYTEALEEWIDLLDGQLPKLTRFILPSGGMSSAHLHVARSVCRSAERRVVTLVHLRTTDSSVACYLNRLSDFLFAAARCAAMKDGREETTYKKGEGKKVRPVQANE